jgi:hypothetical protein
MCLNWVYDFSAIILHSRNQLWYLWTRLYRTSVSLEVITDLIIYNMQVAASQIFYFMLDVRGLDLMFFFLYEGS